MRLCPIASGSSGNCTYIGTDTTHILIDAGISCKRIKKETEALGISLKELSGIFITHEHADHIQGLRVLLKQFPVPLFMTPGTRDAMLKMPEFQELSGLMRTVKPDERFILKDMAIRPFSISHDAAQPVGYVVSFGHKRAAVCTDLGEYTEYTVENLKNLDALVLEANHDLHMLQVGPYPYPLKKRIMGSRGHLSNETSGALLGEILNDHMKGIFLGHLSQENNMPLLALESVRAEITLGDNPYQGRELPIEVAKRNERSTLLDI